MTDSDSGDWRRPLVLVTSSAPWGKGEAFFHAEAAELARMTSVLTIPVWPRGELRGSWPAPTASASGQPNVGVLAAVWEIFRRLGLLRLLRVLLDARRVRVMVKHLVAAIRGAQWAVYLRRNQIIPCHIHAAWISGPASCAWVLGELLGVSVSATAHRGDILECLSPRACRSFLFVRAISDQARSQLERCGIGSIQIPLGALSPKTSPGVSPGPPSEVGLRLVAIGSLLPVKGHLRAIRIVDVLRDMGRDVQLDIVGSGPLLGVLEAEIRRRRLGQIVVIRGELAHGELLRELNSGRWNIILHTSLDVGGLKEGVPASLLEAAQAGLCLVASESGAIPEFLLDGCSGLLVGTSDQEAVRGGVNALEKLVRDPQLFQVLTRNAAQRSERFLATSTVPQLCEALKAAVEASR